MLRHVVCLVGCLFFWPSFGTAAELCSLEVAVAGIAENKGKVRVALWNDARGFPEGNTYVAAKDVTPSGTFASVLFREIPCGQVAVSVYQDSNENKTLDKNFMGIPSEAYGFSNNPAIGMGPPVFQDATITLETKTVTEIFLRN